MTQESKHICNVPLSCLCLLIHTKLISIKSIVIYTEEHAQVLSRKRGRLNNHYTFSWRQASVQPQGESDSFSMRWCSPLQFFSYCSLVNVSNGLTIFWYVVTRFSKALWHYHITLNSENKREQKIKSVLLSASGPHLGLHMPRLRSSSFIWESRRSKVIIWLAKIFICSGLWYKETHFFKSFRRKWEHRSWHSSKMVEARKSFW